MPTMARGGEGRGAPVAANVDVVVGENHRLASGAADALQDEARRIGAGAVAHWHILGHWLTWSNPAHLPAGRSHLSYSASAAAHSRLSMLIGVFVTKAVSVGRGARRRYLCYSPWLQA